MPPRTTTAASTAQADAFTIDSAPPPEVVAAPTAQQEIKDSHGLIAQAKALRVTTPEEYKAAGEIYQKLRGAYKNLDEQEKGITRPQLTAIDRVRDFFRPHKKAAEAAGLLVRDKINGYDREQQRIAEQKQREAEEEARRKRAEEEAAAKKIRDEAEAKAKLERDEADRKKREQDEADRKAKEQREAAEKAEREAREAKERGDKEAAEKAEREAQQQRDLAVANEQTALQAAKEAAKADIKAENIVTRAEVKAEQREATAASVVAPIIQTEAPKVAGIARRMVWKHRVVDESKVARAFLVLDEKKIGATVRAMGKDAVATIGGIEVWQENDISGKAKS